MKLLFLILSLFETITTKVNSAALSDVENPTLQLTLGAITIEKYKNEELENIKNDFKKPPVFGWWFFVCNFV